jgi:hypothetical protein
MAQALSACKNFLHVAKRVQRLYLKYGSAGQAPFLRPLVPCRQPLQQPLLSLHNVWGHSFSRESIFMLK